MCIFIYVIYQKHIFLYIIVILVFSYNNELTLNLNEGSILFQTQFSKFNINYLMEFFFHPILERAVKFFYLCIIYFSEILDNFLNI